MGRLDGNRCLGFRITHSGRSTSCPGAFDRLVHRLARDGRRSKMRPKATTLAIASVLLAGGSVVGAWATPDWWEAIPLLLSTIGAGVLAATAVYLRANSLL